jgi:hypothetical protein
MNALAKTSAPASATSSSDQSARHFAGSDNASYEPHLVFDNVINPSASGKFLNGRRIAEYAKEICNVKQCPVK